MGTQKEQWKFEPGSRDDIGLHCAHTTDERKHACVNACTGMADPAGEIRRLRDAVKNALTWEGRLNQAEQMLMQGDREAWKKLKLTVQYEMDLARTALSAKEAE